MWQIILSSIFSEIYYYWLFKTGQDNMPARCILWLPQNSKIYSSICFCFAEEFINDYTQILMMTCITQLRWQRYADKYCWWFDNFTHYSCLLLLNYYCYFCCTDATMLFTQKRYHITRKTIFSLQWFTKNKQCNFCNWDFACDPPTM